MSKCLFLADPNAKLHDTGPGHPESPARWDAAMRGLSSVTVSPTTPRLATIDELALCHQPTYIEQARRDVDSGFSSLSTGDTEVSKQSFDVAQRAVGTLLNGIDQIMTGETKRAFCVVRPPGHHATPSTGMGFCLFNNIAVAARYSQQKYGVERVLIADWDVHHGNGTQDIFYNDGSVFFFSTHQYPWYPGTGAMDERGADGGKGTTMNFPFAAGASRDQVLGAFKTLAENMSDYRPDLVLVSAGFDSRRGDPLGQFLLNDNDFADLTLQMLEIADKYAGGKMLSSLEGGYNLAGLTSAVASHAAVMNAD